MGFDIGSIAAGALGIASSAWQTNEAEKEAQANREFQQGSRATSYQTAVKDMEAAGLNPAMMYDRGGAGAASVAGSQANVGGEGPLAAGMNSALGAAQVQKVRAEADVAVADAENKRMDTWLKSNSAEKTIQDTYVSTNQREKLSQEIQNLIEQRNLILAEIRKTDSESDLARLHGNLADTENQLRALKLPESEAYAAMYRTDYGKALPYLKPAMEAIGSGAGAYLALRRGSSLQSMGGGTGIKSGGRVMTNDWKSGYRQGLATRGID